MPAVRPHASLAYWSPDEVAECTSAGEEGATYAELWSFVRDGAPVTVREIWKQLSPQAQETVNRAMVALEEE